MKVFCSYHAKQTVHNNGTCNASNFENSMVTDKRADKGKKRDDSTGVLVTDEMMASQNYPRHVPVHVLDSSLGTCTHSPSTDMTVEREFHGTLNPLTNPAASANTESQNNAPRHSAHQSYPQFHPPFPPFHQNQDDYRSFLHMSSTFSSLIVSTLLQNPAAHAAASFAASFWPYANVENSAESSACAQGSFPPRPVGSPPSLAAIAAATVAAATAWWAAHGLLPVCAPLHSAFTCAPPSATAIPSTDTGQASSAKTERKEHASEKPSQQDEQLDQEVSEALQAEHSASKLPIMSSSDSEQTRAAKPNSGSKATEHEKAAATSELLDANKTKGRKQVARSSCGSNTPSGSEAETDALEKSEKGKEESKKVDANQPGVESSNRRSRSSSNLSDPRKEVSEEVLTLCFLYVV